MSLGAATENRVVHTAGSSAGRRDPRKVPPSTHKNGSVIVKPRHGWDMTSLHDAARAGDAAALLAAIAQGASLDQRDAHKRTPLHLAAWAGQLECVKALLAAGCQKGAGAQDDMNAIHFAAQRGHTEVVRHLLNEGGLPVCQ